MKKKAAYKGKNRWEQLWQDLFSNRSSGRAQRVLNDGLVQLDARDRWILCAKYGLLEHKDPLSELQLVERLGVTTLKHTRHLVNRAKRRLYYHLRPRTADERRVQKVLQGYEKLTLYLLPLLHDPEELSPDTKRAIVQNASLLGPALWRARHNLSCAVREVRLHSVR